MLIFVLFGSKTNDFQRKVRLYDNFYFKTSFCDVCGSYCIDFFSMLCVSIPEKRLFSMFFSIIYFCEIVHFNLLRNKLLIRMLRSHMTKYSYYAMHANSFQGKRSVAFNLIKIKNEQLQTSQ